MYKKILSVTAALALAVGVFAGCGNKADQEAINALNDQLETVTASYGGVADVVAQYGSVQQNDELNSAKAELDEVAAKAASKNLSKDDVVGLTAKLNELLNTINSVGEAAQSNVPDETPREPVDAQALADKFEQVATLLGGVYANVSQNGTVIQQQVITDAQEQISEMQAGIDAGTYTNEDVMDALELIEALAQSINDNTAPVATEGRDVNSELETLATLVSGARESIDAGSNQLKKDFIAIVQNTVSEYGSYAINNSLTPEQTAEILEGVDILTQIVNLLNA